MVRAWRSADVAACRAISNAGFSEKYHVSQSWEIVKMVCPWTRHFTRECFT